MSDSAPLPPSRVYTSPGVPGRPTVSLVIVTLAAIYGVFEIVRAVLTGFQNQIDLLFGIFFIGGGIYGFNKTWTEARDAVVTFDVDRASGKTTVGLWRPFRPLLIETGLDGVSGWRHFVKLGPRDFRTYVILADLAGYPRPIRFDLPRGKPAPEGLRRVAPGAVAEFEEATGQGKTE
jgi:hypothetical protein